MQYSYVDRARMTTATHGTGTLTLGTAVSAFQSFQAAGLLDGDFVEYLIEDGIAWEIGTGTYSASGTMSRSLRESSTGALLALDGNAVVSVVPTAQTVIDLIGYANTAYPLLTTKQAALDYLLYVAPAITAFSNTVGTVEIGSTVTAVTLNWAFNKAMTTVTLDASPISPTLTTESYSGLDLTADTTYTLEASDGTNTASASTTVGFAPRRWWGTSPLAALASADILALQNSEFASGRDQSRIMSATAAYLYFAWPSSFGGPASFTVNGLPSTAWVETTISATNASGYTQDYDVYRSTFLQNGSGIAITVS